MGMRRADPCEHRLICKGCHLNFGSLGKVTMKAWFSFENFTHIYTVERNIRMASYEILIPPKFHFVPSRVEPLLKTKIKVEIKMV